MPGHIAGVAERLSQVTSLNGLVTDVRVGALWTVVVAATPFGPRAGLASTQIAHDLDHGRPAVRDAGRLIGRSCWDLIQMAGEGTPTERSIGFAALNASIDVDEDLCSERNAEDLILERGAGRQVAVVGHFPFVPRVRAVAKTCWVLELNPGEGDLPADQAPAVIPQADLVAITGMSLVNGTFEPLAALCRPDAFVVMLGATTPLSPVLYEYGVDALSGVVITDIPAALLSVSQAANFRQISGKRLLTMERAKQR
jgi:uncharacterized protein